MIGKVIKSLLDANEDLNTLVAIDNRYPYVINENTSLPAIVYTIDSISPEYDKNGWVGDEITFSIISLSDNYNKLQDIVLQIRLALELKKGEFDGITIERIQLSEQSEGFNLTEGVFINKLSFIVEKKSY